MGSVYLVETTSGFVVEHMDSIPSRPIQKIGSTGTTLPIVNNSSSSNKTATIKRRPAICKS